MKAEAPVKQPIVGIADPATPVETRPGTVFQPIVQDSRSAADNNKVPVINNFDNIATNQLESEKIPTPPVKPGF